MPRRKPRIDAVRWELRDGTHYDIYFPGSNQHVAVLAKRLKHNEVKALFYTVTKTAPTLLGLNGMNVEALGRIWKFSAGRYTPIEGECRPEECPNFFVHIWTEDKKRSEDYFTPPEVWIYFQRHQTGTKAVSLAIALSRRVT